MTTRAEGFPALAEAAPVVVERVEASRAKSLDRIGNRRTGDT
jgi:hypothetical protein